MPAHGLQRHAVLERQIIRGPDVAHAAAAAFAHPAQVTSESDVAEAVWLAANDSTGRLRFPAGADALALAHSA
jgi:hypothetical protein